MKEFNKKIFQSVYHFPLVDSTNKLANKWLKTNKVSDNFLIIADEQTEGRGRKGNYWHSPAGGLWMTAGLKDLPVSSNLTIYTGICVFKTLALIYNNLDQLSIKWPNDIYLGEKKIGGIITTYHPAANYHLIGIGINTNLALLRPEISKSATALLLETQKIIDNIDIAEHIFQSFHDNLEEFRAEGLKPFLDFFAENSYLRNKRIVLKSEKEEVGTVRGIDEDGALLIEDEYGNINVRPSGSVIQVMRR